MKKICKYCNKEKELKDFPYHAETRDRLAGNCRLCKNELQREYRQKVSNVSTKKYEKTKNGFLVRMYRNMTSRIVGIQKKKSHLYAGKELLSKESFYNWAKSCKDFHIMFKKWESSNYDKKLTPTVDRINSEVGYLIQNMQWLTHSENSRKGAIKKNKKTVKIN